MRQVTVAALCVVLAGCAQQPQADSWHVQPTDPWAGLPTIAQFQQSIQPAGTAPKRDSAAGGLSPELVMSERLGQVVGEALLCGFQENRVIAVQKETATLLLAGKTLDEQRRIASAYMLGRADALGEVTNLDCGPAAAWIIKNEQIDRSLAPQSVKPHLFENAPK